MYYPVKNNGVVLFVYMIEQLVAINERGASEIRVIFKYLKNMRVFFEQFDFVVVVLKVFIRLFYITKR